MLLLLHITHYPHEAQYILADDDFDFGSQNDDSQTMRLVAELRNYKIIDIRTDRRIGH